MIKQNLHTHTVYCDGKNTIEDMIKAAIKSGFSSLGFSGHSYLPFDERFCMSPENTKKYCEEIDVLKEKYKNQITIYKGIEFDTFSNVNTSDYDYVIGSVHFIPKNGSYLPVDLSADEVKKIITEFYNGNCENYIRDYFEEVKKVPDITNCHILGHIDLITKFCESDGIICADDMYLKYAFDAIHHVSKKIKVFEVNTGAMSRGYRKTPYPDIRLLKEMKNCGMMPIISSDCHDSRYLDYGFNSSLNLVKCAGYTKILVLENNNFIECPV